MTIYYLAVWGGGKALSDREAAKYYASLLDGEMLPEFDAGVYAFNCALTRRYPDLEMLGDEEADASPWAATPDISGGHMIVALQAGRYAEVFPLILELAHEHGLVCFDPQTTKVHLPAHLPD